MAVSVALNPTIASLAASVFTRTLGGDQTLHPEIDANARRQARLATDDPTNVLLSASAAVAEEDALPPLLKRRRVTEDGATDFSIAVDEEGGCKNAWIYAIQPPMCPWTKIGFITTTSSSEIDDAEKVLSARYTCPYGAYTTLHLVRVSDGPLAEEFVHGMCNKTRVGHSECFVVSDAALCEAFSAAEARFAAVQVV